MVEHIPELLMDRYTIWGSSFQMLGKESNRTSSCEAHEEFFLHIRSQGWIDKSVLVWIAKRHNLRRGRHIA